MEPTTIVNQILNTVPKLDRGGRQRNLGEIAAKTPHAARIDTRGVSPDMILFDDHGSDTAPR